jgi:hypothetical protein
MSCSLLESLLGEEADTTDNNGKVVEAIYRFSGGEWYAIFGKDEVKGAVSTLGETTFTVYGGGVSISFTSVYTEGGGIIDGEGWAYLYDGSGKIGIVLYAEDSNEKVWTAIIGKTFVDGVKTGWNMNINTNGMQNTYNGAAQKYVYLFDTGNDDEINYKFNNGEWYDSNVNKVTGAVSSLDANTFKVTGGGVSISYTNVHTEYGGIFEGNKWAYLYDGSGKIGFVLYTRTENLRLAVIGKTCADKFKTDWNMNINTTGMQNTQNGTTFEYFSREG